MASDSFQTVLTRRNELLHRQAIWKEITEHLQKFLDTDAAPAKVGIATEGEGIVVPQHHIEEVIAVIQTDRLDTIFQELHYIDQGKVSDYVKPDPEQKDAEEAAGEGRKGKGQGKRRRGIPKSSGHQEESNGS